MTSKECAAMIAETRTQIQTATGYRKKDLIRHLRKLQKEMHRSKE